MKTLPESFLPHIGISQVELADETEGPMLPQDVELHPVDAAVENQLEELLRAQTFHKMMLDALHPVVRDQSILRPGKFHQLRLEVMQQLESAIAETSDEAAQRELFETLGLLRQMGISHELGEQYRYSLLKG